MLRKKILIDLDVLTIALWKKRDERKEMALRFLEEVGKGKFEVITPFYLMEQLKAWKDGKLASDIARKLFEITTSFEDRLQVKEEIEKLSKIKAEEVVERGVKELKIKLSDVTLILHASSKKVDYLVTFNKKHLKNKEEEIYNFLKRYGLHVPKIVLPEELLSSNSKLNKSVYRFPSFQFLFSPLFFDFVSHFFGFINFAHKLSLFKHYITKYLNLSLSHSFVRLPLILSASSIGSSNFLFITISPLVFLPTLLTTLLLNKPGKLVWSFKLSHSIKANLRLFKLFIRKSGIRY